MSEYKYSGQLNFLNLNLLGRGHGVKKKFCLW